MATRGYVIDKPHPVLSSNLYSGPVDPLSYGGREGYSLFAFISLLFAFCFRVFLLLASRFLLLASRFSLLTFSFSLLASYF